MRVLGRGSWRTLLGIFVHEPLVLYFHFLLVVDALVFGDCCLCDSAKISVCIYFVNSVEGTQEFAARPSPQTQNTNATMETDARTKTTRLENLLTD